MDYFGYKQQQTPALWISPFEMVPSTNELSSKAVMLMTLRDIVLPSMGLHLKDLYDLQHQIYIHHLVLKELNDFFINESPHLSFQDILLWKSILSKEYHDIVEMLAFTRMLDEQYSLNHKVLRKIFSVNGCGSVFRDYIPNLQYPMKQQDADHHDIKAIHVNAVRQLYEQDPFITPLQIHDYLVEILEGDEVEILGGDEVRNPYSEIVGNDLKDVKEYLLTFSCMNFSFELLKIWRYATKPI